MFHWSHIYITLILLKFILGNKKKIYFDNSEEKTRKLLLIGRNKKQIHMCWPWITFKPETRSLQPQEESFWVRMMLGNSTPPLTNFKLEFDD